MSELFELNIHSSVKSYTVKVGTDIVKEWIENEACILIVDQNLLSLYPWLNSDSVINIIAKEENKTFDTIAHCIEKMRVLNANRQSHVIAIGGGITQDLATFVSSSYMRGVRWSYCATTLLGMADSCIGGKSSINVGAYKNIAGNFFPPELVLIDTCFCKTLADEQKIEGLLEAIKICFSARNDAFEKYLTLLANGDFLENSHVIANVIALSLQTKKVFIEEDEFDEGIRLLLNFGHTFGHAIESATDFQISHGVAVGLGMLAAIEFSLEMNWTNSGVERVVDLEANVIMLLSMTLDLPAKLHRLSVIDALDKFRSDKKHKKDMFTIICLDQSGFLERRFVPINEHSEKLIKNAFERVKRKI